MELKPGRRKIPFVVTWDGRRNASSQSLDCIFGMSERKQREIWEVTMCQNQGVGYEFCGMVTICIPPVDRKSVV